MWQNLLIIALIVISFLLIGLNVFNSIRLRRIDALKKDPIVSEKDVQRHYVSVDKK